MTLQQHAGFATDDAGPLACIANSLALPLDHELVLLVFHMPTGYAATLRRVVTGAPGPEVAHIAFVGVGFELLQRCPTEFVLWLGNTGVTVSLRYLAAARQWFGPQIVEVET